MAIKRNSAKCVHCGTQIVSSSVHDFNVHYCKVMPRNGVKWVNDELIDIGDQTYNFFVDGGNEYLRRGGHFEDMEETSIEEI